MKRVLIIDDEKSVDLAFFVAYEREEFEVRDANRKAIKLGEFVVSITRNIEDGIELLKSFQWDLLLLDGRLPDDEKRTGVRVMEFLRDNKDRRPTEIRFCTGDSKIEHEMYKIMEKF